MGRAGGTAMPIQVPQTLHVTDTRNKDGPSTHNRQEALVCVHRGPLRPPSWKRGVGLPQGKRLSYLPITMWAATCTPRPHGAAWSYTHWPAPLRPPPTSRGTVILLLEPVSFVQSSGVGWNLTRSTPLTPHPGLRTRLHTSVARQGRLGMQPPHAGPQREEGPHASPCRYTWCSCPPPTSHFPRRSGRPASKRTCSSSWAGRR